MKKVININFQGRVIPIEEAAYEELKRYVDSLRAYFAAEEGREEIINDIEGRIGELFSERLSKGATCITGQHISEVIAGMGRPEDLEAEGTGPVFGRGVPTEQQPDGSGPGGGSFNAGGQGSAYGSNYRGGSKNSLYRNADDKVLGGVCSGLANYFSIDPVVMRIIFVVLFGLLFWVYIVLWILVPSRSAQSNITKRLYRNPDQKMIAGVCGGIAAYFNIQVWVPRLIFMLPLIIALVSGTLHGFWWHWNFGFMPGIVSGSFGWTLFLSYVILWIAIPEASTASEKLEMRGEKVDFHSIASAVKEDLGQIKTRAEKFGAEIRSTAKKWGEGQPVSGVTQPPRRSGGLGDVIVILMKAVFIFIFAIVAVSLFGVFIGLFFGGLAFAPALGFFLDGGLQTTLAWLALFLVFVVPMVALVTWAIRRLMGIRSKRHYLGVSFLLLWIAGVICAGVLIVMLGRGFRSDISLDEATVPISQPGEKLVVDLSRGDWKERSHRFFWFENDDDLSSFNIDGDSLMLNTVRISMVKSSDSMYHVYLVRSSRGGDRADASAKADAISFRPTQQDSILFLPPGFNIDKSRGFRNQRVWIVFEVPEGKRIAFSDDIDRYRWFRLYDEHDRYSNRSWQDMYWPSPGKEYIMTGEGRPAEIQPETAPADSTEHV